MPYNPATGKYEPDFKPTATKPKAPQINQPKNTSDPRKGFVDFLFDKGIGQGDASYWYQNRGAEEQGLFNAVESGLQGDKRKEIVDYLFDQGLAQGDREYWYENRGLEDASLRGTYASLIGGTLPGNPAGEAAPGDGGIDDLRRQRLEAALGAIAADFDLQEGQLNSSLLGIEDQFARGLKANQQLGEDTQRDISGGAANRGIGRSGIFARDLSRGLGQVADQRSNLISNLASEEGLRRARESGVKGIDDIEGIEEGLQVRDIRSALELLGQQEAFAKSQAEIESRQSELDLEQLLELYNAGLA